MASNDNRVLGALVMSALRMGAEVDISQAGAQALMRATLGEQEATFWLKLDGGTELVQDASGSAGIFIPVLEDVQVACEEIWHSE